MPTHTPDRASGPTTEPGPSGPGLAELGAEPTTHRTTVSEPVVPTGELPSHLPEALFLEN